MRFPDFLIIGAAKSGTSSLYHYLRQHPQIYMSPIKEPAFFAYENESVHFRGPGDEKRNRLTITDVNRYCQLFDKANPNHICGEASVVYLFHEKAPIRIRHYIPNVKIIAILRNPIERAFSAYSHLRRDGREPIDSFEEALQVEATRIADNWQYMWYYTELGFYHRQLKRYYNLFSEEQLKIFTYEEYTHNQASVLLETLDFLHVNPNFKVDTSVRHNVSGELKSQKLNNLIRSHSFAKQTVKKFLPAGMRLSIRQKMVAWNLKPRSYQMSNSAHRHLRDLYESDISQLQNLIGKDLSGWLKI